MGILIAGLVLFVAIHVVPKTSLKPQLQERFGRKPYLAGFASLATIAVGLIVWGFSRSEFIVVYDPPVWGRHITMLFVLLGFICLASKGSNSHIARIVRDPLGAGIALWAIGHLFANGDLASVLLFATFGTYALGKTIVEFMVQPTPDFAVIFKDDMRAIVGGIVIYLILVFLHPYVIGVPVIS